MTVYLPMLVALVALLAGLAIGKAWERYNCAMASGSIAERRGNLHTSSSGSTWSSPTRSIRPSTSVACRVARRGRPRDPLVLGNLYREKGQVGRAINIHQGLLQRQHLKTLEHAYILLCLGLDFRRGGFVDRAQRPFKEVFRLDPKNRHALIQLEKLHEEQHQWAEVYDIGLQLSEIDAAGQLRTRDNAILAFLEHELGTRLQRPAMPRKLHADLPPQSSATSRPRPRIEPGRRQAPRRRRRRGNRRVGGPHRGITRPGVSRVRPAASGVRKQGTSEPFPDLCRRLIAANSQDWRARLALARHRAGRRRQQALELLFEALPITPTRC